MRQRAVERKKVRRGVRGLYRARAIEKKEGCIVGRGPYREYKAAEPIEHRRRGQRAKCREGMGPQRGHGATEGKEGQRGSKGP